MNETGSRIILTTAPCEDRHRAGRPYSDKLGRWSCGFLALGEAAAILAYQEIPVGCPNPIDFPYASKAYAIQTAVKAGFTSVLWADSSIVAHHSLSPIWDIIESEGYWFPDNNGWNCGQWTSDAALPILGVTREEAFKIPQVATLAFGLDFEKPIAHQFLTQFVEAANNGSFRSPYNNLNGQVSVDPRVLGHRHDQTAASIIVHRLNMHLTKEPNNILHIGGQTLDTILKVDYFLDEQWAYPRPHDEFDAVLAGACPSPEVKHATVIEYGKRFGLDTMIETGTYKGDNVEAVKDFFSEVYSIELSPTLFEFAKERFKGNPRVHLLAGDSGEVLKDLLPTLHGCLLFWLDAHYSWGDTAKGTIDTPIMQELDTIFALCPDSVILIDDARCFSGKNGYPKLGELRGYIRGRAPGRVFEIKDDIIRVYHDHRQTAVVPKA